MLAKIQILVFCMENDLLTNVKLILIIFMHGKRLVSNYCMVNTIGSKTYFESFMKKTINHFLIGLADFVLE